MPLGGEVQYRNENVTTHAVLVLDTKMVYFYTFGDPDKRVAGGKFPSLLEAMKWLEAAGWVEQ